MHVKLLTFLLCATIVLLGALLLEVVTRQYIFRRDYLFFKVNPSEFPFFKLRQTFKDDIITIRSGRREFYPRENREKKIALVGDSVGFCWLKDEHCFVERLQAEQSLYDIYNFAVPGYGLPEIEALTGELLNQHSPYDGIVYLFNYNDTHAASCGYLGLLQNDRTRFSALEFYEGKRGVIQLLVKDHFKSLCMFKYAAYQFWQHIKKQDRVPSEKPTQYLDLLNAGEGHYYNVLDRMYGDPRLLKKLAESLLEIKRNVEASGSRFILAVHQDFWVIEKKRHWNQILREICLKNGIDFIDLEDVYKTHHKKTGFYIDSNHLGIEGNRLIAEKINAELVKRLHPSPVIEK